MCRRERRNCSDSPRAGPEAQAREGQRQSIQGEAPVTREPGEDCAVSAAAEAEVGPHPQGRSHRLSAGLWQGHSLSQDRPQILGVHSHRQSPVCRLASSLYQERPFQNGRFCPTNERFPLAGPAGGTLWDLMVSRRGLCPRARQCVHRANFHGRSSFSQSRGKGKWL